MTKSKNFKILFLLLAAIILFTGCPTKYQKISVIEEEAARKEAERKALEAERNSRSGSMDESGYDNSYTNRENLLDENGLTEEERLRRQRGLLDPERKTYSYDEKGYSKELARLAEEEGRLYMIIFEYDSYSLSKKNKDLIKKNALWLKANKKTMIRLEGHADERGGDEYNLALGERRALGVKRFLSDLGVEPFKVGTISFGEAKPADPGHTSSAWRKNRRVEFRILR
ncbi:MAG: OmpA family protein [Thermodesulfobacteriota bacterium]